MSFYTVATNIYFSSSSLEIILYDVWHAIIYCSFQPRIYHKIVKLTFFVSNCKNYSVLFINIQKEIATGNVLDIILQTAPQSSNC